MCRCFVLMVALKKYASAFSLRNDCKKHFLHLSG